jgi:16S rRNA (guanine(1405)-N(7))-methyltransferase
VSDDAQLERLVAEVLASPKYRAISPDAVRAIGMRELAAHRSFKDAVKATRNKLHQTAGAFLGDRPRYNQWLAELSEAQSAKRQAPSAEQRAGAGAEHSRLRPHASALARACERVMLHHASTRERLPILEAFYRTLFASLPPVTSVLDLACGLNPLAMPWMPLAAGAAYYACDLYGDQVDFLNQFFALAGVPGEAFVCDLVAGAPQQRADVALALKLLPVLEQRAKGTALALLRAVNAPHIVVSFPTQSLGGRGKGMAANYAAWFAALVAGEEWQVRRHDFAGELVFVVAK